MYFWNVKPLADELAIGQLSQKERMKYLLAYELLYGIAIVMTGMFSDEPTPLSIIEGVVFLILTVFGVYVCYVANKQGDDKEFIDRYICLGLPITLRGVAAFMGIYIAYYIVGLSIAGSSFDSFFMKTSIVDIFMETIFVCIIYFYIRKYIINVSRRSLTTG